MCPHTVEFVSSLLGDRSHALRDVIIDIISIEIAARLLGSLDDCDNLLHLPAQIRILLGLQNKASAFQPLIDV
jgi:hypothetical protein